MLTPFESLVIHEDKIITKHDCTITLDYDNDIFEAKTHYKAPGSIEIFFDKLNDFTQIIVRF